MKFLSVFVFYLVTVLYEKPGFTAVSTSPGETSTGSGETASTDSAQLGSNVTDSVTLDSNGSTVSGFTAVSTSPGETSTGSGETVSTDSAQLGSNITDSVTLDSNWSTVSGFTAVSRSPGETSTGSAELGSNITVSVTLDSNWSTVSGKADQRSTDSTDSGTNTTHQIGSATTDSNGSSTTNLENTTGSSITASVTIISQRTNHDTTATTVVERTHSRNSSTPNYSGTANSTDFVTSSSGSIGTYSGTTNINSSDITDSLGFSGTNSSGFGITSSSSGSAGTYSRTTDTNSSDSIGFGITTSNFAITGNSTTTSYITRLNGSDGAGMGKTYSDTTNPTGSVPTDYVTTGFDPANSSSTNVGTTNENNSSITVSLNLNETDPTVPDPYATEYATPHSIDPVTTNSTSSGTSNSSGSQITVTDTTNSAGYVTTNLTGYVTNTTDSGPTNTTGYVTTSSAGCYKSITADYGNVTSTNYPDNYPLNITCSYNIIVSENKWVLITFEDLQLGNDTTCRYDYIDVQNKIKLICGSSIPEPFLIYENNVIIKFYSDSSTSFRGFSFIFEKKDRFCNEDIEANNGTIISPNYPNPYPLSTSCVYDITVAVDAWITISFTDFQLEWGPGCKYDRLIVDDRSLCGTNMPEPILIYKNNVRVIFVSDYSVRKRGYSMDFTSVTKACNETIEAEYGTITSPNYPDQYPLDTECTYNVTVPPGKWILLSFTDVKLEDYPGCRYDHVYISYVNEKICGAEIPDPILIQSNQLILTFISDYSQVNQGFSVNFTSLDEGSVTVEPQTTVSIGSSDTSTRGHVTTDVDGSGSTNPATDVTNYDSSSTVGYTTASSSSTGPVTTYSFTSETHSSVPTSSGTTVSTHPDTTYPSTSISGSDVKQPANTGTTDSTTSPEVKTTVTNDSLNTIFSGTTGSSRFVTTDSAFLGSNATIAYTGSSIPVSSQTNNPSTTTSVVDESVASLPVIVVSVITVFVLRGVNP
ncbi:hypothetical protein SNE40_004673 [Patella caerulea]|uniref:CUB domain-containing protein n=1 Tax=Patella caerulea TaxID=87958 RepID=A0AAN8K3I3_PATCE